MVLHVKDGGVWKPVKDLWVKDSGVWKPVRRAFVKDAGVWKQYFQDEVVATISGNVAQVVLPGAYFTPDEWANPILRKRLIVASGANVWSYTNGVPALDLGTGRSGDLYVDVQSGGYILGHAGVANGGTGGTAIKVRQNNCWINNAGFIYGGGGAGGVGGQGGPGVWYSGRTITEGEYYNVGGPYYLWQYNISDGGHRIYYGGYSPSYGPIYAGSGYNGYAPGDGWTYYKGTYYGESGGAQSWAIYRQRVVYDVPNYTSGGAGGAGGKGAGYNSSLTNGSNAAGSAGAAGGTNAGTGGTGGTGGGWGAAGNTGGTGSAGNNGGGSGGGAGGLGGLYIDGNANLNGFTNTGSVLGRVA